MINQKSKESIPLAIFDFCDTLIPFQSTNRFIEFVVAELHKEYPHTKRSYQIWMLLKKSRLIPVFITRRVQLRILSGLPSGVIDELSLKFYSEIILPSIQKTILAQMNTYRSQGFRIGVISGGFDCYLQHLPKDLPVDFVLSTGLEVHGEKYTGEFLTKPCLGSEKVARLKKYLDMERINIDHESSVVYSDSLTDLPLFRFVGGRGFYVCKVSFQISEKNLRRIQMANLHILDLSTLL